MNEWILETEENILQIYNKELHYNIVISKIVCWKVSNKTIKLRLLGAETIELSCKEFEQLYKLSLKIKNSIINYVKNNSL